jgi:hypothetical protein
MREHTCRRFVRFIKIINRAARPCFCQKKMSPWNSLFRFHYPVGPAFLTPCEFGRVCKSRQGHLTLWRTDAVVCMDPHAFYRRNVICFMRLSEQLAIICLDSVTVWPLWWARHGFSCSWRQMCDSCCFQISALCWAWYVCGGYIKYTPESGHSNVIPVFAVHVLQKQKEQWENKRRRDESRQGTCEKESENVYISEGRK